MVQDLTEMATFAEVVSRGTFTAAGEALGVSKGFVSKQISSLETRLGVVLLRRTTRSLRLTEEGERFYEYCRRLVDTARDGFQLMQVRSHEVSGLLRMSAPITFGQVFLPEVVSRFCALYPAVEVDLVLENRVVDLLTENYDIAFRITETPPEPLSLTPLRMMEDIVCGAPSYLDRRGRPQVPADLRKHECLLYMNPNRNRRWTFRRERKVEVIEVDGHLATNHHHALKTILLNGAGLAKIPEYAVAAELKSGQLESVLKDYQSDTLPIYLVHHHPAGQPPRVREFVRFIQENSI